MAASSGLSSCGGFFSRLFDLFKTGSKHDCMDPAYLFLLGQHITKPFHEGCLKCSVSHLPELSAGRESPDEKLEKTDFKKLMQQRSQQCFIAASRATPNFHLDLSQLSERSIEDVKSAIKLLASKRSGVETISIPEGLPIDNETILSLKALFPKLKGLRMGALSLETATSRAIKETGTKNIDFSNSKLTDDQLKEFIQENPDIENLDISNCSLLTDVGFSALSSLKNLKSLKAAQLINLTMDGLRCIPTENLVYLDLSIKGNFQGCGAVCDDFCLFLSSARNLRYLNLSAGTGSWEPAAGYNFIGDVGLASLAENNPLLEVLLLSDSYQGTSDGYYCIERLKNLVELDLSRYGSIGSRVTGVCFEKFGTLPKLSFLRLTNILQSNDAVIFQAFENSKLVQLWIDGTATANSDFNEGISYLPTTLMDLRIASNVDGQFASEPLSAALCQTLTKFSELRSLWLTGYVLNGEEVSKAWEGNLKKLLEFSVFSFDEGGIDAVCSNSTLIENLNIFNPFAIAPETTEGQFKPITKLKNLRMLLTNTLLPEQFLFELFASKPTIEVLKATLCSPALILAATNLSSTLKEITVTHSGDGECGLEILPKFKNLESLTLSGNYAPDDYGFISQMTDVKSLTVADLYGVPEEPLGQYTIPGGVDDQVVAWIGQMPSLKSLTFYGTRFGDEALKGIERQALNHLTIFGNGYQINYKNQITGGAIPTLCQMKTLKTLDLNNQLSSEEMKIIKKEDQLFWAY